MSYRKNNRTKMRDMACSERKAVDDQRQRTDRCAGLL
jgi:hypothetical protein